MDKKTEALKLALEALEDPLAPTKRMKAITAIREALAEQPAQQQEPSEYVQKVIDALYENSDPTSIDAAELLEQMGKQQEPVAFICEFYADEGHPFVSFEPVTHGTNTPLYSTPPQRKPLTDEQISDLWDGHTVPVFGKTGINPIVFARAIEAKLKEKNA